MKFDVSLLSTNEYLPQDIIREEIPEKYLYDTLGEFSFVSTIFNSEETISHLINFLFRGSQLITEVYRDKNLYVLDLSSHKEQLIDFDYLDKYYPQWIVDTARENSLNEFGILTDFIGYATKGMDKKYLLMIVSSERHRSKQTFYTAVAVFCAAGFFFSPTARIEEY